ncbi:hypothetical protein [Thermospira aquatica]|uniref:YD repeat-containing protein n=1 Tax=Thermospira aquatica TaxID=2828656 RepID=A0AAX3BEV9_9SPIR|nr:hypothetical protein [Thermospira aquatica]URA10805.1 hypothetical protein KDW03_03090 [Thermospira aquatica]
MKKRLLFLISLVPLFVLSCQTNPRSYRAIGFDERYMIVGRSPLKKALTNRPFYTIWYDSKQRPLKIVYGYGNILTNDPVFNVAQIVFEYTPLQEKRTFLDASNQITFSSVQKYAQAILDYNDRGQAIRVRYYGTNGEVAGDFRGVFSYRLERDSQNRVLRTTSYNTNDEMVEAGGFASVVFTYDKHGNLIEERYLDKDGNPAKNRFWGYAIRKNTYDKKNRLIERAFYDENDNPVNYNLWHIHKYRYLYDKKGKITNTLRFQVSNGMIVQITE